MKQLPEAYLARMQAQLGGESFAAYLRAMGESSRRALRANPLKTSAEAFAAEADGVGAGQLPREVLAEGARAVRWLGIGGARHGLP